MAIKTTSVKVDEDLWELAKKKGYKLQDIINNALLSVCMVEMEDNDLVDLEKQYEDLKSEIELVERTKERKIEEISNEYDIKIMELNVRLNAIEEKIVSENENQRIIQERENQREKLLNMFVLFSNGVLLRDEGLVKLMVQYSNEFDLDIDKVRKIVVNSQYKPRKNLPDYADEIIDGKLPEGLDN